ncbi:ABC transporter permease [Actinoplanes sp. GCM10030250]|uniref:ABC transporter permease n=1 Tax=Actinoplanes sp. GCM10030250 TaxID=3273376 RepID=UPI00361F4DE6
MTAATTTRSAYPRAVADLLPHARELAAELGTVPSRNKLMTTFNVGAKKANDLLTELTAAPAAPVPVPEPATPAELPDRIVIDDKMARLLDPSLRPAEPAAPTPAAEQPAEPKRRRPITWPVLILCLPAFVAIWGGWVEMGRLTGFGKVTPLPGIADNFQIDTAITLPIGVETYAAYALYVWLSGLVEGIARNFAMWSAIASLLLGGLGQIAYHLMVTAGWTSAPWPITAAVSCIPVAVLGMGAGLAHLMHKSHQ